MWECLAIFSTWVENNSGWIQILIALIALGYAHYQINLFKKQRYFELRLQLMGFIYEQLEIVKDIKLKMLKTQLIHKNKAGLTAAKLKLLDDFLKTSGSPEGDISEIENSLEIMLHCVNDDCDAFSLNELEVELRRIRELIKDIGELHDCFNRLEIMLDKDSSLK